MVSWMVLVAALERKQYNESHAASNTPTLNGKNSMLLCPRNPDWRQQLQPRII